MYTDRGGQGKTSPLMQPIVFIVYILFFNWLVLRVPFIKKSGLPAAWITALFSLKVIAGLLYAWFYLQPAYYPTSDTWNYFNSSKSEASWLLHDPGGFFRDIFVSGYPDRGNLFLSHNSYWNDLRSNLIIKMLAICNVFTFSNYFADIVIFNFLFFLGPIAVYRLVLKESPAISKGMVIVMLFLVPSFLFWCSGIHKDGLIFSAIALCLYYFHAFQERTERGRWKFLLGVVVCLVFIFLLRNFIFLLLLPALGGWYITQRFFPKRPLTVFSVIYILGMLLFFVSMWFPDMLNAPLYIIRKQEEFRILPGHQIRLPELALSVTSFLQFLPYAIRDAFLQPWFTDMSNLSYVPAAVENVIILVAAVICVVLRKKDGGFTPFMLCCLFFAMSVLLLVGYTVTSPAGIVRYKSVVLPLLLIPLVLNLDPRYFRRAGHPVFSKRGVR